MPLIRAAALPFAACSLALALLGADPALAQTVSAAGKAVAKPAGKPAAQSTGKPARTQARRNAPAAPVPEPEPPMPPAAGEQIAAAAMAHYGDYACEFDQTVQVSLNPKHDAYIDVRFGKLLFTMKPILSSTGALRLEDVRGRVLMLQIADKSMLMDTVKGNRLVDACVHETQRQTAERMKADPSRREALGIAPGSVPVALPTAAAAAAPQAGPVVMVPAAPIAGPVAAPVLAPVAGAPVSTPVAAPAIPAASVPVPGAVPAGQTVPMAEPAAMVPPAVPGVPASAAPR